MALFKRKSDDQKAEDKAFRQGRDLKRKGVSGMLSKVEQLNFVSAINVTADEVTVDEEALFAATGELDGKDAKAALVATDKRIIIGWMKGLSIGTSEIRYEDIDQIDVSTKLSGASITLRHGSHATKLEKSATKNLDRLKEIVRSQQQSPQQSTSGIDDLAKLAELHSAGVLTDAEFSAAKAKALGL